MRINKGSLIPPVHTQYNIIKNIQRLYIWNKIRQRTQEADKNKRSSQNKQINKESIK